MKGVDIMKTRRYIIVSLILVTLLLAYFGSGYAVYDRLSTIEPPDEAKTANSPVNFKVTYEEWADFDAAPYWMSAYEDVRFPSRQPEIMLSGWYIEGDPDAPVIIVTHGISASKRDANVLVPAGMLARNGFSVLLYDLRNHGESDHDNGRTSIGNKEYQDVLGAWDWLVGERGFSPDQIGLYGTSLGGGSTLMAFGQEPRAAAAFIDSAFSDLRQIMDEELRREGYPVFLDGAAILSARLIAGEDLLAHSPQEAVRNDAGRPIYLVHGTADERINVHHTKDLAALAEESGANVTVWLQEGLNHVTGMFALPAEYERRLIDFFEAVLK